MLSIKNPIVLFICMWTMVLFFYSKRYSYILTELEPITIAYILLSCFVLLISFYVMRAMFVNVGFASTNVFINDNKLNYAIRKLSIIWGVLTCVEIIYFRGLPLLALLGIGSAGAYTEWGIPSLHGLLNAMIITLSNYNFYLFIKTKKKKYLYYFILCLFWPILLVTRQVMMSMVVQAMLIYVVTNKIRLGTIFKIVISALCIICIFGIIGDLRSEDPESFKSLAEPSNDYPMWLPSGFLWVYIYISSPLNNINFNIYTFPYFKFNPGPVLAPFFPSVVRDKLFTLESANYQLVKDYLNVSSVFPTFLNSFGLWGSVISYFFLGLFLSFVYLKTKLKRVNIKWAFVLVVLLHNVIFSVFVDFFTSLVFVFQIILHLIIGYNSKLNNDKI